jgi:transposase InsO family protein
LGRPGHLPPGPSGVAVPDTPDSTDNGDEFSLAFKLTVEEAGIEYRYIRPRRPQQDGKVERSHRIDHEEFWSRQRLTSYGEAETALRAWEQHYNVERFSALQGQTPSEKLAAHRAARGWGRSWRGRNSRTVRERGSLLDR